MSQTLLHAEKILKKTDITDNVYFHTMSNGEMSLETFRDTQTQFYFSVAFFARPMSALIARISEPALRLTILQNIMEEHGNMSKKAFHTHTFKDFLNSIGQNNDLSKITVWPQINAFNHTIIASCTFDAVETGIACLGIIERAFVDISTFIANTVVDRNWLTTNQLKHYKIHKELDLRHAFDFFDMIDPFWDCKEKQKAIVQGLELGAYAFDRLYQDLAIFKIT